MKKLYTLLLLFTVYITQAQISITQSDMPNSGDTIRYSTTTDVNDYVVTGANYTWDYSNLTPNGQGKYEYKSALAINPIYVIPFGLFGFGLKISDGFGAGPISLSNIYNFFNKSASKYTVEGYGAEVSGIPLPSTYSDPDEFYQFPLNYDDHDTSTYDVTINIPTIGGIRMIGTRINIAEGWGTLMTPYDTVSALKIKTYTNEIDSVNISLLPFPFAIPRNTVIYKWLSNTEKIPVLEVTGTESGTGTFTATQIRYRDRFNASAIPFTPVADFTADRTVCSTIDTVNCTNNTIPPFGTNTYSWNFSPSTIIYVGGTSSTDANPRVQFTANGLYTVSLSSTLAAVGSGGVPVTDDTTKVDYILVRENGVSIEPLDASSAFKIYPNPVQNEIEIVGVKTITQVQVLDMNARIVMKDLHVNGSKINVEGLTKGNYLLEIIDQDQHSSIVKFVKN